jgi:hypothetical protein
LLAPPDDDGFLLAPLLITEDLAAAALGVPRRELQRLIDRRLIDVVHLGPRKIDLRVKAESLRRSFGARVLLMKPAKPVKPVTLARRSQPRDASVLVSRRDAE